MPLVASASLFGSVAAGTTSPATLKGAVSGDHPTLTGAVSRLLVEAEAGPSVLYDWEVWLGDHWVPREHLRGPFEVEESISTQLVTFSFSLAGSRYGMLATAATWTRTPVEVWTTAGPPEGPMRRWPRAVGYVHTCEQTSGHEPQIRVTCADPSILFDRFELCHEVAPGSGLRRDEIAAAILAGAGITADIPPGAVYDKPLLTDSRRLWEYLQAFGEPEGWSWRFRTTDQVLEAFLADLKPEPQPPDRAWTPKDFQAIRSSPPKDVPHRVVVRGTRIVRVNETGVKTTLTRTTIEALYAPRACLEVQLTDGTVVSSGSPPTTEILQPVSVLEDEVQEAGGRLSRHTTREWGWYNPRAAKLRTPDGSGPGPVEEGYYWASCFLDPDGEPRAWPAERFVQVGERREVPVWEGDSLASSRTETIRWHGRTMGVRNVQASSLNAIGAGVAGDDQSYFVNPGGEVELFGLAQADHVSYDYAPSGAVRREVQETFAFRSPRVAVEANPWWLLYDGTAQFDLIAQWGIVKRQTKRNLVAGDGTLAGVITDVAELAAPRKVNGTFDWGDFRSNSQIQAFGTVRRETVQYNVLSEDQYEEVVSEGTGAPPTRKLITGRVPMPRYRGSAWTTLQQQPLELAVEDSTLAGWFGRQAEVLNQEFLQSLEEAKTWLERRRRRRVAFTHEISGPRIEAVVGDTILLEDLSQDLRHRCLLTRIRESWTLAPVTQVTGTYFLEQPL